VLLKHGSNLILIHQQKEKKMKRIWTFFTVLILISALVSACAPAEVEPTATNPPATEPVVVATEAPTVEPTLAPTPTTESQLDKVLASGKLVCATSADFPPMEFVNEDGTFAGFDIDFISELATRLGVDIEVWDMPFDSVVQSVQDGKVDCAIAAMGPTPARDEQVDFTISYKKKTYVLMANTEHPITINQINDVAQYRLGTLSGGLQVKYFEDTWITPGLMPADNLVQYDRTDSGILDLAAGRLDLWWTQDVVAQVWSQRTNVYTTFIVPQEILGGDTVIMLPQGDAVMKARFDEIITSMLDDGTRDRLLDTWSIPRQ
jgi:polar amino acid transport system substrate-binding protein